MRDRSRVFVRFMTAVTAVWVTAIIRKLRVLVGIALLAACSAPAAPHEEITEADLGTLHLAEEVLLRDCLERAGFEYRTSPLEPGSDVKDFPYVIDDVAWAGRHGYGTDIQHELDEIRISDPNQLYFQSLPPERRAAALKAANGERPEGLTARTPDGMVLTRSDRSCRTDAERELYGDVQAWFQARSTITALTPMRNERVIADPRFTQAVLPWADCMRAAGHPYPSPAELRATLPPPEQPLPKDQEVQLALTEANCALNSGLADTAEMLDQQYDNELRRRYQHEVETADRLRLAALPHARPLAERADPRK